MQKFLYLRHLKVGVFSMTMELKNNSEYLYYLYSWPRDKISTNNSERKCDTTLVLPQKSIRMNEIVIVRVCQHVVFISVAD